MNPEAVDLDHGGLHNRRLDDKAVNAFRDFELHSGTEAEPVSNRLGDDDPAQRYRF